MSSIEYEGVQFTIQGFSSLEGCEKDLIRNVSMKDGQMIVDLSAERVSNAQLIISLASSKSGSPFIDSKQQAAWLPEDDENPAATGERITAKKVSPDTLKRQRAGSDSDQEGDRNQGVEEDGGDDGSSSDSIPDWLGSAISSSPPTNKVQWDPVRSDDDDDEKEYQGSSKKDGPRRVSEASSPFSPSFAADSSSGVGGGHRQQQLQQHEQQHRPEARWGHTMTRISNPDRLVVYGGQAEEDLRSGDEATLGNL